MKYFEQTGGAHYTGNCFVFDDRAIVDTSLAQVASGGASVAALGDDGRVLSWGYYNGQGTASGWAPYPNYVKNPSNTDHLSNIVSLSVGSSSTFALAKDGTVYGWGWNNYGELANGNTVNPTPLPSQVLIAPNTPLTGGVAISAGYESGMALTASGNVYAWGIGVSGVLGQGSGDTSRHLYAVKVKDSTGTQDLAGIAAIAAGGSHMLALTTTGKVLAWGSSGDGQRGEGLASQVINQSYLPIPVVQVDGTAELSGIIGIKAGQNHSLAVTSTGDVLIWGGLGLLAI